jgi:hypothetical protein
MAIPLTSAAPWLCVGCGCRAPALSRPSPALRSYGAAPARTVSQRAPPTACMCPFPHRLAKSQHYNTHARAPGHHTRLQASRVPRAPCSPAPVSAAGRGPAWTSRYALVSLASLALRVGSTAAATATACARAAVDASAMPITSLAPTAVSSTAAAARLEWRASPPGSAAAQSASTANASMAFASAGRAGQARAAQSSRMRRASIGARLWASRWPAQPTGQRSGRGSM